MTYLLEHERRLAELRYSQSRLTALVPPSWATEVAAVVAPEEAASLAPGIELLLREAAEGCSEAVQALEAIALRTSVEFARRTLNHLPGTNVSQGAGPAMQRMDLALPATVADLTEHMVAIAEFAALVTAATAFERLAAALTTP